MFCFSFLEYPSFSFLNHDEKQKGSNDTQTFGQKGAILKLVFQKLIVIFFSKQNTFESCVVFLTHRSATSSCFQFLGKPDFFPVQSVLGAFVSKLEVTVTRKGICNAKSLPFIESCFSITYNSYINNFPEIGEEVFELQFRSLQKQQK